MANIVFVTAELFGGNEPQLAIADELRARGHQIVFVGPSSIQARVEAHKCRLRVVDTWSVPHDVIREIVHKERSDACLCEFLLFGLHDMLLPCPIIPICHFAYRVARASWSHLVSAENVRRAQRGAPRLPQYLEMWRSQRPMLVLSTPEFDEAERPGDGETRYVGPYLDCVLGSERVSTRESHFEVGIVLSMNAHLTTPALLQQLTDATARTRARIVTATSGACDPESIQAPSGGAVVKLLDLPFELQFLRVLVSHGGHGGVMQAIAAGVPLVCWPGRLDQPANAARVVELGLGFCLGATSTSQEIAATVECAMYEHSRVSQFKVQKPLWSSMPKLAANAIECELGRAVRNS